MTKVMRKKVPRRKILFIAEAPDRHFPHGGVAEALGRYGDQGHPFGGQGLVSRPRRSGGIGARSGPDGRSRERGQADDLPFRFGRPWRLQDQLQPEVETAWTGPSVTF